MLAIITKEENFIFAYIIINTLTVVCVIRRACNHRVVAVVQLEAGVA